MARRTVQVTDPRHLREDVPGRPVPPVPPARPRRRIIDYPRFGRRGWRRWVPSWRLTAGLVGLGLACVVVAFSAAYAATKVPTPDQLARAQTSVVYYAGGKAEIGRFSIQNRRSIPLASMPKSLQAAVLAAEDRTFYSNSGFSPTGMVRAAVNDVRGRSLQGGSTITQQYVKNYFDLRDRTLTRKVKEFFIALKINHSLSKDAILEDYLNAIYLGRNSYGVEAASLAYFGVHANQLNVSQSAFLAGIINGPELYDPADPAPSPQRAQVRWHYVLDGMVKEGSLSSADAAKLTFPKVIPQAKNQNSRSGQRGYLMDMVSAELRRTLGYSQHAIDTGGLRIVTTFNPRLISDGVKAVKNTLGNQAPGHKKAPSGLQVGMATIDPNSGAVLAIYGGADYLARARNAATQDEAVAGSTFKPFALLAALQGGMSLRSRFDGHSPQTFDGFAGKKVSNFGDEQFGMIDLVKATEHSVNTVFVGLNEKIGAEHTYDAAVDAGIPASTPGLDKNPANVLGGASPHPIDMASAYATLAAGGVYHKPYVIAQVSPIGGGKTIYVAHPTAHKRFEPGVVADAVYAMQQVVKHGTGSFASNLGRPAAGKTGTSSSNLSAWFVGFTPQMSTAVAMYRIGKNGNPMQLTHILGKQEVTGGSYPTMLWTNYMSLALDNTAELPFPDPVFGGDVLNPAPVFVPTPTATPTATIAPTPTGVPTASPTLTTGPPRPSRTRPFPTPSGTVTLPIP